MAHGLLELLKTKPFREITVTQLCEQSQVARRTFYRHFDSIEHVLKYQMEEIIKAFKQHMQALKNEEYKKILTTYFAFWDGYMDILTMLSKNNLDYIIFIPYLSSLAELPWLFPQNNLQKLDEIDYNCALAYHAGGLWSTLIYWITNGHKQSPDYLAEIVCAEG